MIAAPRSGEEAVREGGERLGGDPLDLDPTFFCPARELAASAVELAVGSEEAEAAAFSRRGGDEADEEVVRVGREDDGVGISSAELPGNMGLRLGPNRVHHLVPLAVGEAGGIVPRLHLAFKARVWPQ